MDWFLQFAYEMQSSHNYRAEWMDIGEKTGTEQQLAACAAEEAFAHLQLSWVSEAMSIGQATNVYLIAPNQTFQNEVEKMKVK